MQASFDFSNEHDTEAFAKRLARALVPPLVLTFSGDLGAGKTTLVRAMLRALGVTGAVKSPTFSLVESYDLPDQSLQVHHFDLYRIEDEAELDYIGFQDYFSSQAICCIEWPERARHTLRQIDASFSLRVRGDGRVLDVLAKSVAGDTLITWLVEGS
jgi:tRNA threonylcarbamoyladenosine biosynthesis protein TsaE